MRSRILALLLASIILAGCSGPDSLTEKINAADQCKVGLDLRAYYQVQDIDGLNMDLTAAKKHRKTLKQIKALADKREALVREHRKTVKELNDAAQQYNNLVATWERTHNGQKYHRPECFMCF